MSLYHIGGPLAIVSVERRAPLGSYSKGEWGMQLGIDTYYTHNSDLSAARE